MIKHLYPATVATIVFAVITGLIFPALITGIAMIIFPDQAKGSLVFGPDGKVVGSRLIAQEFKNPRYFHPRPSAAGAGYSGVASGSTNLGPTSDKLINGLKDGSFIGIKGLTEAYRQENNLEKTALVPVDAVTRSGSGLDSDISVANANLQARRVATARQISEPSLRALIDRTSEHRLLGFIGEHRVNVLMLNLALDTLKTDAQASTPNNTESARKNP